MKAKELEEYLHQQIPLSKALGVSVVSIDSKRVAVRGLLQPNRNHLGTAFGGSLAAISILAGYAWLFNAITVEELRANVILKSMRTDYLRPVDKDFVATCQAPAKKELEHFFSALKSKGMARLPLTTEIRSSTAVACRLEGEFVAKVFKGAGAAELS